MSNHRDIVTIEISYSTLCEAILALRVRKEQCLKGMQQELPENTYYSTELKHVRETYAELGKARQLLQRV